MRHSICVGVDDSRASIEAARVAASLARALDRRLVLVHVADDPPVFPYADGARREQQRRQLLEHGDNLISEVATQIGVPFATGRIALTRFTLGGVQERLVAVSREERADLLVIGARTRHRVTHALFRGPLWSRFTSLAGSSPCPLLVVPSGAASRFADERAASKGTIVCGIDGSAGSERARRVATDLADGLALRLLPVSVERARRSPETAGVLHVMGHDPAQALAEAAIRECASLIVVGMGSREMRSDSVPRELAVTAQVPVLIVAPGARQPAFAPARIGAAPDGRAIAA